MLDIRVAVCGSCGLRYAERSGIFAGACSPHCWTSLQPVYEKAGRSYKRWQKSCAHCYRSFTPKDKTPSRWRKRRFCSEQCSVAHVPQEHYKAMGRKGGQATQRKVSGDHFKEIGKLGGLKSGQKRRLPVLERVAA